MEKETGNIQMLSDEEKATISSDDRSPFRILLVSHYCPTRTHAGGLRVLDIYAEIRAHCPNVHLDLFTYYRKDSDGAIDEVYKIFDQVYFSPISDLKVEGFASLRNGNLEYDIVDLQFHPSGHYMDGFRDIGKKLLFTPMESMARVLLIDLLSLITFHKVPLKRLARDLYETFQEISFCRKADATVCVSQPDAALLRVLAYPKQVHSIDTCLSKLEFAEALSDAPIDIAPEKKEMRIVYVAYFGSANNIDALHWYLNHVHPLIKAQIPNYVLSVIGRGDLSSFSRYEDSSIDFVGEVPLLSPHVQKGRVGIAPALGGSGFRGKVNLYSLFGISSVVSPIAAKGLAYTDGKDIFISQSPYVFAERCIQLLGDAGLNRKISAAAQKLCLQHYIWESKWLDICDIYGLKNRA